MLSALQHGAGCLVERNTVPSCLSLTVSSTWTLIRPIASDTPYGRQLTSSLGSTLPMHTKIKRTLSAGAIMLGVALLTPTTAVYFFGLFIALSGLVSHGAMRFTALGMLLLLLVPGYGLFSSWWLLFRFRELEQIRAIPKPILGGLAAGIGVAILFLWISNSSSPSLLLSPKHISNGIIAGGGPFLVSVTLMAAIHIRGRARRQ